MKRLFIILLSIAFVQIVSAQFLEDFSDGDFIANPTWQGDTAFFNISSALLLQSDGPSASAELSLATQSKKLKNTVWEFDAILDFPTSTSNYGQFYLAADTFDFQGNVNGYFVRLGGESGSTDGIDLYVQQGTSQTKIIDGPAGFFGADSNNVGIHVSRDYFGNWELFADTSGAGALVSQGITFDSSIVASNYIGVYCRHTSTRRDLFYFDNISVRNGDFLPVEAGVISPTLLEVTFSNTLDSALAIQLTNYSINNGIGIPSGVQYFENSIQLSYSSSFPNGNYSIQFQNLLDNEGQSLSVGSLNFNYFEEAGYRDIVINEIFADPSPPITLPEKEFIEIYNASNIVFNLQNYIFEDAGTQSSLPAYFLNPGEHLIICAQNDTAVFQIFGNTLGLSPWPTLNNSGDRLRILNTSGTIVDEVNYSSTWYNDPLKSNGGWSLEQINPNAGCSNSDNWSASINPDGGTPGMANSIFNNAIDTTAPVLLEFTLLGDSGTVLLFNEAIDTVNFTIGFQPSNQLQSINKDSLDNKILRIFWINPLQEGDSLKISISGIADCEGNEASGIEVKHERGFLPLPGDLIINEIFPDPNPQIGLPTEEFIEIFNLSNKTIDLVNSLIEVNGNQSRLPAIQIPPRGYLILCPDNAEEEYQFLGNALGLDDWRSLINSGASLKLLNSTEEILDEIEYSTDWYQDVDKDDGGWSLERINPEAPCSNENNWRASISGTGGTPGTQNSVFDNSPDITPPEIQNVFVDSSNLVRITISEPLAEASLNINQITISPQLGISALIGNVEGSANVRLELSASLDTGIVYTVMIDSIQDCSGNINTNLSVDFGLGRLPQPFELLITEVMSDENPSQGLPEFEYFEIYNSSNAYIDLSMMTVEIGTDLRALPPYQVPPRDYVIFTSNTAAASFENFGATFSLPSWPGLNNASDQMHLERSDSISIHFLPYDINWIKDPIKKEGGFALEMIDFNNPCGDQNNWDASQNPLGGTPGQVNSFNAQNPDLRAPIPVSAIAENSRLIEVHLNERVIPPINPNIKIEPSVLIDSFQLNAPENQLFSIWLGQDLLPNIYYTIEFSGIDDCVNNTMGVQIISLILPEKGDSAEVIVNEILFNPYSGGAEFIELYNPSDKNINLKSWNIAKLDDEGPFEDLSKISDNTIALLKHEYLVLTEDSALVKQFYPRAKSGRFLQIDNLPSLNNEEDDIVILDSNLNIIDWAYYHEDFHLALLDDVKGVSLEKVSPNISSLEENNWKSAAETYGFATPGYLNSQNFENKNLDDRIAVEPTVFSPNGDGYHDFTTITINGFSQGDILNLSVYDLYGQEIAVIAEQESLGLRNTFRWDGTMENGEKARISQYILLADFFNLDGTNTRVKKVVALADHLGK